MHLTGSDQSQTAECPKTNHGNANLRVTLKPTSGLSAALRGSAVFTILPLIPTNAILFESMSFKVGVAQRAVRFS